MSHNDHSSPIDQAMLKDASKVARWVLRRVGQNRVATPLVLGGLTAATLLAPDKQEHNPVLPQDAAARPEVTNPDLNLKKTAFAGGSALTLSAIVFGPKAKKILHATEKAVSQAR